MQKHGDYTWTNILHPNLAPHGRKSARYAIHNLYGTSMGTWMAQMLSQRQWGRSAAGATTSSLNIRLIVFWRRSPLSLNKNIHRAKPQISKTHVLLMFYLGSTYFRLILGLSQLIINLRYLILARNKFNTSSTQVH